MTWTFLDMPQRDSLWTDDRVDLLRLRWSEGVSAGLIARELDCGLSRNAVIGKADRMKLGRRSTVVKISYPRRNQYTKEGGRVRITSKIKAVKLLPVPVEFEIPVAQRRTLAELERGECHYPVGDPGRDGFFYCGARLEDQRGADGCYCAHHHRLTHGRAPSGRKTVLRVNSRTNHWV